MKLGPLQVNHQQEKHYIANHLSYKLCDDLNIYKKSELESTYVEIINQKTSNVIVGMIYRHLYMNITDFNKNILIKYLNGLLDKISKEDKNIFLLGNSIAIC